MSRPDNTAGTTAGAVASVVLHTVPALRDRHEPRIRPVRPADAGALQEFLSRLSARSRYLRFFRPLLELPSWLLTQLVEADGVRTQVLVAVARDAGGLRIVGLAQTAREADDCCEFALVVADDWQGRGLGRRLLDALLASARAAGVVYMRGDVLRENRAMLRLARTLGFAVSPSPLDATALRVGRALDRVPRRGALRSEPYAALSA